MGRRLIQFFYQKPASIFIEALETTEVFCISKNGLDQLYERMPQAERYSRILFQNAYISFQERINQSLSLTAEERYTAFLQKYPNLQQRVAQKHIASYLGITPEFLSLLRKKMARKGIS